MRKILLLPLILMTIMSSPTEAWWWSDDDDDNQQQAEVSRLQYQVDQEQQSKDTWQIIAFVLGVGCVVTLVAGAAIGSHARQAAKEDNP